MDTFLNAGMNEAITERLGNRVDNTWFAWDNYRRFLQCWDMSFDLERNDFDAITSDFKMRHGIPRKRGFTGEQMKQVAKAHKEMVRSAGIEVPEGPFAHLVLTILCVVESWNRPRPKPIVKSWAFRMTGEPPSPFNRWSSAISPNTLAPM